VPRPRTKEARLRAWELFRSEELLEEPTVETMLAGLWARLVDLALGGLAAFRAPHPRAPR
jgi:hypothetical protein